MSTLWQGQVRALYAQVALFDAERKGSYPEWDSHAAYATFGPAGVIVGTADDANVDVVVVDGERVPSEHCFEGVIDVGQKGLFVGNIPAEQVSKVEWPPGPTRVSVHVDGTTDQVRRVVFALKPALDTAGTAEGRS